MTISYQAQTDGSGFTTIIRANDDGSTSYIPEVEGNSDYAAYLAYVANGNKVPDSTLPSELSTPTTPQAGA